MTPAEVLVAFTDQTRGEGGELVNGAIVLQTIAQHFVVAYPGGEGWWEARLEVRPFDNSPLDQCWLVVPLKQGPVWYADSDTAVDDVVSWLREITNSQPDQDDADA